MRGMTPVFMRFMYTGRVYKTVIIICTVGSFYYKSRLKVVIMCVKKININYEKLQ